MIQKVGKTGGINSKFKPPSGFDLYSYKYLKDASTADSYISNTTSTTSRPIRIENGKAFDIEISVNLSALQKQTTSGACGVDTNAKINVRLGGTSIFYKENCPAPNTFPDVTRYFVNTIYAGSVLSNEDFEIFTQGGAGNISGAPKERHRCEGLIIITAGVSVQAYNPFSVYEYSEVIKLN